jgi:hypothetical protein
MDAGQQPASAGVVLAARVAAALLVLVAAFHAAVVLGAPWGEVTQGGGTTGTLETTGRTVAAFSCILALVMAVAVLGRVGEGPLTRLPARVTTVLAWLTTVYAVVAVVLNLVTRSTAERALWAPVSLVLLALVAYVMVRTRAHPAVPAGRAVHPRQVGGSGTESGRVP